MTRPSIPYPDLETEIEARMQPAPARDRWFWLRASGYFAATMFAGLGILIGMLVMCGFAAVFWGIDRMRKVWK